MVIVRYTAWDGTQRIRLTADAAFARLADLLSYSDDVAQALDGLLHQGLDHDGVAIPGIDALLERIRQLMRERQQGADLRPAMAELRDRLDAVLEAEGGGPDDLPLRVSDAIARLRAYPFARPAGEAAFQELLDDLDDIRDLEEFWRRYGELLSAGRALDLAEAIALMRALEQLRALEQQLATGDLAAVDVDAIRELLGDAAAHALLLLREVARLLEDAGYLTQREGRMALTARGVRRMGQLALRDIYQGLLKDRRGPHRTDHRGLAAPKPEERRPWQWGEPLDLDLVATLGRAVARGGGVPLAIAPGDFTSRGTELQATTATVLLLDMSWSMSWEGRFAAAKKVALAMESLIRARYPRDYFGVVGFFTRAVELKPRDLPEASWNMGDPFTNLQDGLRLATRLLMRHPSTNKHAIVITDGQPTAYSVRGRLYCEWPLSFGGISMRAASETLKEVERVTRQGIVINTFMLDDSPGLRAFVERMTRINRGRALYTRPDGLGRYLLVDYLRRQTKRV